MAILSPTPYWGNAHPCSMYRNGVRLAGYKWHEQTGTDMPFEDTYNDRVDVVAQGKSSQVQTVQGKNLLDPNKLEYGGLIGSNGAEFATTTRIRTGFIPASQASNYSITVPVGYTAVNTHAYDSNKQRLSSSIILTPANTTYIRVSFGRVDNADIPSAEFTAFKSLQTQIELGSTATPYEPFVPNSPSPDYPSPITSANGDLVVEGRNLCPNTINKINVPYNQGSNTIIDWPSFPYGSGMYIVSCFLDATNAPAGELRIQYELYADNGTTIEETNYASKRYFQAPGRVSIVFTAIKGRRVRLFVTRSSSMPANTLITAKDAMLERGPVAHPYTPYRQIITHTLPELRGIPDGAGGWVARDELYVERVGGEWHLMRRQRVGRYILTGQAGTFVINTNTAYCSIIIQKSLTPGIISPSNDGSRLLCTHAPYGNQGIHSYSYQNRTINTIYGYPDAAAAFVLTLRRDQIGNPTNGTEVRAWLAAQYAAGTPVTVDYILATPIITDLGPVDLPSYYPYTRVLVSGDYPPDVTATCKVVDMG